MQGSGLTRSSSRLLRTAIVIPVVCLHVADRQDETLASRREPDEGIPLRLRPMMAPTGFGVGKGRRQVGERGEVGKVGERGERGERGGGCD